MKIKYKDIEGEIIAIGDLSMTLKTINGTLVVPIKEIVENQVEIQGKRISVSLDEMNRKYNQNDFN